jgi:predicted dithiol-disulfide oxidoreductase (DUF899 family)
MDRPQVVSRDEWLAARKDLLSREKVATKAKDEVDACRRSLPMVEITKEYAFAGPGGQAGLPGLFGGRRQLIVYHFMWRHEESGFPGQDQGCPTCSVVADNIGDLSHLRASDTTLVLVSRAPLASIERFRKRMGWPVPWYSSLGSDGAWPLSRPRRGTLERSRPWSDRPGCAASMRPARRWAVPGDSR